MCRSLIRRESSEALDRYSCCFHLDSDDVLCLARPRGPRGRPAGPQERKVDGSFG